MIRAVLVDDERISLSALTANLDEVCSEMVIAGAFDNPRDALHGIPDLKPDVLFLDIEMPNMNGFSLLKAMRPLQFEVIFTTAYSEFAIEALRISALDFLLKPIDMAELKTAIENLQERIIDRGNSLAKLEQQLQVFFQYEKHPYQMTKIALPVLNGLEFIETNTVIKIEGDNVYSIFHLTGNKKLLVTRTLKEVDILLSRFGFLRVHKSFIINLSYIVRYIKGEGGTVILSDGSEVDISRRSKAQFLARVNNIK